MCLRSTRIRGDSGRSGTFPSWYEILDLVTLERGNWFTSCGYESGGGGREVGMKPRVDVFWFSGFVTRGRKCFLRW